jgi:hypothetical protein
MHSSSESSARNFADIQFQQNHYVPHQQLTERWIILHEIWAGIRRHPDIISVCSLYKFSKKIAGAKAKQL